MEKEPKSNHSYDSVPTNESQRQKRCAKSKILGFIVVLFLLIIIGLVALYINERFKQLDDKRSHVRVHDSFQMHTNQSTLYIKTYLVKNTTDLCLTPACIVAANSLLESIDETVNPCENFYEFACGNWIRSTKIPAYDEYLSTQSSMQTMLESALVDILSSLPPNGNIQSKATINVRDWYNSCIDESAIDEEGVDAMLSFINKELGGWPVLLGSQWNEYTFDFYRLLLKLSQHNFFLLYDIRTILSDQSSSLQVIKIQPNMDHAIELGHPSFGRKISSIYMEAFIKFAMALSDSVSLEHEDISAVFQLETKISMLFMINAGAPSVKNSYIELNQLSTELNISSDFVDYIRQLYLFANVPLRGTDRVYVLMPKMIHSISHLLSQQSPRTLQNYLIWRFMIYRAWNMPKKFRNWEKQYQFIFQYSGGELPRSIRCVHFLNEAMHSEISGLYINKYVDKNSEQQVREMVNNIRNVIVNRVNQSTWIGSHLKHMTIQKIRSMKDTIGYSDYFENNGMSKLEQHYAEYDSSSSFMSNTLKLAQLTVKTRLRTVRDPSDNTEWTSIRPTMLNVMYHLPSNKITLPAAFLQKPFFDSHLPKYLTYGGIGFVIGHEIAHVISDKHHMRDMFSQNPSSLTINTIIDLYNRTKCLVDQYNNYTLTQVNEKMDGNQTLPENLADIIGLRQAFFSYQEWAKTHQNMDKQLPGLTKYSAEQLFFINFGHAWCIKMSNAVANKSLALRHAPHQFRVIGPTSNFEEFDRAFGCQPGQENSRVNKCIFW